MLRWKMFSSAAHSSYIKTLEADINGWLESAHPAVRQVVQSSAESGLVVSFLYDDAHREMQMRMTSAMVPEAFERSLTDLELDPADEEPTLLPDAELPY